MPLSTAPVPETFTLRENMPLAPLTTFGIGGPARWFTEVHTEEELAGACGWAEARGVPVFVLGGGSNVLVSDAGFDGLVIRIALRGVVEGEGGVFRVAAGEDWDALVSRTVERNCAGMECLAGIPGSVGGTPVQNVGAYGQEVAQTITAVRCFDRHTGMFARFTNAECGFRYRTSRFNTPPDAGRYVVTEVEFRLTPGRAPALGYADLQRRFPGCADTPSLGEVAEAVGAIRRGKGMVADTRVPFAERDPDTRSAGSFFKNPVVSGAAWTRIAVDNPPSWPAPDGARKVPAAWLLEQAGFGRGYALGEAGLSTKHTLALCNRTGLASARDVLALRDTLQRGVEDRFGIRLEPEPIFVGTP